MNMHDICKEGHVGTWHLCYKGGSLVHIWNQGEKRRGASEKIIVVCWGEL